MSEEEDKVVLLYGTGIIIVCRELQKDPETTLEQSHRIDALIEEVKTWLTTKEYLEMVERGLIE